MLGSHVREKVPFRKEPSHKDLYCLIFGPRVLTDIPICNDERVQIQRRKSSLQKLRDGIGLNESYTVIDTVAYINVTC